MMDRSLDLGSSLFDASVTERLSAKARSRKAKHDGSEQHSQRTPAGPGPGHDEHRSLADATVSNARFREQSAQLTIGRYVPIGVNHASLSATLNVSAAATAGGTMTHNGGSPSPIGCNDLSSFMSTTGGATAAVFETESQLSVGAGTGPGSASPAMESMTVTTDKADYAPGSMATFIVAGVNSGSSVAFEIADVAIHPGINGIADVYAPFSVTDGGAGDADGLANGTVVARWQVPADGSATGAMLQLTAISNAQTAITTFSDAPNKIVSENLNAGTPKSVWAIHGSIANQGDSQIEGFATQISANAGQTVSFKIDTASSGYTLDIYRLGYYGGNGARLITSMHHSGADNQPDPIFNAATNTVDAGNWSVTDSWAIPSTAVSGVYFAKLTTDTGNFQNMIPFIVRNDGTTSDLLFQTSDTTWEAYNPWGGYNLYQGPSGSNVDRAYAVSYNRPIAMNVSANEAQPPDFLFGEEYAAIYWLEQNGYNVSYISGIDAATNAALLLNTKAYIDVGHDEYWSQSQYANVKAAADAGVNLAFLSGNQIYWDTQLAPSFDASATPNRTIVEYKDIWSGTQLDPNGTTNGGAGLFRDPVYGPGTPENSLSGTIFTVDDIGTLDNISVPASMSQLRFWTNTSIASGNGGTLTNLLGYEWDSDVDNGFRPTGLIDLSSTTRTVGTLLLDNGATTGPGTATHSLTLYRDTTSGALIFGAGTVMWSWGLSNQYAPYRGLTAPVSTAVQQSMVNLFADMGVTPQTLQASLVLAQASTDHTSPTAIITSPTGGTSVGQGQAITITGTASDVGGRVAGIEVSTDGGTTWHPAAGTTNWSYTWTAAGPGTHIIEARATDDSVNLQSSPATLNVNVTGSSGSGPSLFTASNTPTQTNLNDGSPLEVGVKFQSSVAGQITALKFYRSASDTGPDLLDLWTSTGTKLASATFTNTAASGWQTVTLATPVSITANTTYVASYHTTGEYVVTDNFFTTALTNGVLTAPSTATAGGNGVYAYGGTNTAGIFPTSTFSAANYYADVVFANSTPNTPPTAVADTADATEKGGIANGSGGSPATGNVLTNDTDPDVGDTKTVTAVSFGVTSGTLGTALNGAHGSLVLNASGTFTYTVNETDAAVQALRLSTNTLTDVFNYTMRDTAGATSATTLAVTIHGANDAPVLAVQTGSQNAIVGSAFSLVLPAGTFTDVDAGDTLTYTATAADGSPLPTWLTFNAATKTFSGTPAATDVGTLSVKASATDLGSLAASETFNIAVTTTPNTPPTAVADTADATEKGGIANGSGGSPATGNVLTNDTDPDVGDTKTVTAVSFGVTSGTLGTALNGAHGSLVLNASGTFTYTVNETDAAVQALRLSTNTLTDVFNYTMRDTAGATSATTLAVTIHGANDAPVLAVQTGSQNAIVGSAFSLVLPAGTFTDVDAGDTLTYTATAADGSPLPTWLTFNAATKTFSGTPAATDVGTLSVKASATDLGSLAASETFNIAVAPATVSLFTASNTPAQTNLNDGSPLEVGMKFASSVAGQITALKFYRSSSDTGPDLLDLWTSTGTKLASATFTNTAASGWQTVTLATPVSITANTTYVASYHTTGEYVVTDNFFTTALTNGVLTAPSTATAGGNGVYAYGGNNTAGIFPTSTFSAANYYADVVFANSTPNTPPTAVADTADATEKGGIANGSGGSPATGNVLTNDTDPDVGDTKTVTAVSFGVTSGTLGTALNGAHGSLVLNASGTFTYTVNETDAAVQALRLSTNTLTDVFNYTMRDTAGATSATTLAVTIHGANDAPVLAVQTGSQNAIVGSAFSLVLPAGTFTDVDAGDTLTYTATAADGSPLPTWLTFNAATKTFSGTPAATDVGTLSVKASATDLGSLAASETFNIAVTTTPNTPPTAVADTADATEKGGIANGSGGSPATGNVLTNDTDPDVGDTKTVTAVSFGVTSGTLGTALNGAHGSLVLNASGTFTYTVNETDAAVQALRLSTNTLTDVFNYTMRDTAGATSATTLAVTIHGANDAPVLAVQTGSQNAIVGSAFSLVLPAGTFTDVDAGDTLTYTATAADGSPLPTWLTFNAATKTFSGTPAATDVGTLSVKASATDLGSLAASETFNIAVAPATVSLFTASNTPAQTNLNDGSPLEVGMKFQSSVAGQITALKFYRSSSDTGPDLLDLWTSTGTKLASATFTNTAASGWQTVTLATPVSITANTTYVASYHTTGEYVATDNFFTTALTNGVLTAPSTATAGGNGVYAYGGTNTAGLFPTNTFSASNYYADVVFRPQLA